MFSTNTNRIMSPITGPLTIPAATAAESADLGATRAPIPANRGGTRVAVVASALALLAGLLLCAFALPAGAATPGGPTNGTTGSGVGAPAVHPVASKPGNSSSDLVFAGLCVAGILATAGGVLAYTVRTRRTLD
jgi:hypothetical protein